MEIQATGSLWFSHIPSSFSQCWYQGPFPLFQLLEGGLFKVINPFWCFQFNKTCLNLALSNVTLIMYFPFQAYWYTIFSPTLMHMLCLNPKFCLNDSIAQNWEESISLSLFFLFGSFPTSSSWLRVHGPETLSRYFHLFLSTSPTTRK